MLAELFVPNDQVSVAADGIIHVREATFITRDGEIDTTIPPKYHRYVLTPGDDLTGLDPAIVAIAEAAWTQGAPR
jgi:hypothetical protein